MYFPLDTSYQDLAGRLVAWIILNRHIPQDTWTHYHAHHNHFQTAFRHKVFHNLDPYTMLEVVNTMNQISVHDALSRLKEFNTSNWIFTGIDRTRAGGTLLLFGEVLTSQVEETIRDIRKMPETIIGMTLDAEVGEIIGLEAGR